MYLSMGNVAERSTVGLLFETISKWGQLRRQCC
jgi:hypothetical protein